VGADEERGNLAIVCDGDGLFKAKKQLDGGYTIAISQGAAAGKFSLEFDSFVVRDAKVIGNGQGPAFITFPVDVSFFAHSRST
jgi:hypothetical protein